MLVVVFGLSSPVLVLVLVICVVSRTYYTTSLSHCLSMFLSGVIVSPLMLSVCIHYSNALINAQVKAGEVINMQQVFFQYTLDSIW